MSNSAAVDAVDEAVTLYLEAQRERGRETIGFQPRTLDGFLEKATGREWTPTQTSYALQKHREYQQKHLTFHTLASHGYGTESRWLVLKDGNGDIPANRVATVRHSNWVAEDLANRAISDFTHEIHPAAKDTEVQAVVDSLIKVATAQMETMRDMVKMMVQRYDGEEGLDTE